METIDQLKLAFGVKTSAEAVSKALALVQRVTSEADSNHTVLFAKRDGTPVRLRLTD